MTTRVIQLTSIRQIIAMTLALSLFASVLATSFSSKSNSSPHQITVWRTWGGWVGSHCIFLISTAAIDGGNLLRCCCARIGCSRPASVSRAAVGAICSATVGGSYAALASSSLVASVTVPTESTGIATITQASLQVTLIVCPTT